MKKEALQIFYNELVEEISNRYKFYGKYFDEIKFHEQLFLEFGRNLNYGTTGPDWHIVLAMTAHYSKVFESGEDCHRLLARIVKKSFNLSLHSISIADSPRKIKISLGGPRIRELADWKYSRHQVFIIAFKKTPCNFDEAIALAKGKDLFQ